MSIDYGEKEREFLDSLATDTGRDLPAWMAAITEANLSGRNEIIDWLRHQGFMFSKASWLERIFNNGGKPVYADRSGKGAQRTRAPARPRAPNPAPTVPNQSPAVPAISAAPEAASPAVRVTPPEPKPGLEPPAVVREPAPNIPAPAPPAAEPSPAATPPSADLDTTLAKAKAFRPLATYLLTEIRKALPDVCVEAYAHHLSILHHETEVAVVALSAKDVRLFLAALGMPFDAGFSPAKMPQGLIGVRLAPTHMVVLTDARAITPALIERVREAALKAADKAGSNH